MQNKEHDKIKHKNLFDHKRVLQDDEVLNRTVTSCEEPLKSLMKLLLINSFGAAVFSVRTEPYLGVWDVHTCLVFKNP